MTTGFEATLGLGLAALGVKRGDVVAIMAEGMPEWLFSDLGTQGIGGVTNGVYTTDSAKQVQYIVSDSNTVVFIAENEEQLDKILEIRSHVPCLNSIIVCDPPQPLSAGVETFQQVIDRGKKWESEKYWAAVAVN